MSEPFLYEFLYRGQPKMGPSPVPPAWHVIIGQYVSLPGQPAPLFVSSGAMTPQQAEEAGYPLPTILDGINDAALASRDMAMEERDAAIAERDAAVTERNGLREELTQLKLNLGISLQL